ncbi:hypothetical protein, partial [Pseudoalteromonas sp. S3178]|uniref:hypothetical protein n=1 Tax=Pseudoalteromonas sp. S3178 TaxID=579532 RepID=UPI002016653E
RSASVALLIVVLLVLLLFITESALLLFLLLLSLLFSASSLYSLCVARVKSIEELAVCSLLAASCSMPCSPVSLRSASFVFD